MTQPQQQPTESQTNTPSTESPMGRSEQLAQRDEMTIVKNDGANAFHAALAGLYNIPGVEVEMSCDTLRWLRVRRQGITYGINKRSGPSTGGKLGRYVYALGTELRGSLEFPIQTGNCYGDYATTVNALKHCLIHDPRQDDIPEEVYQTHVSLAIPIKSE